MSLVEKQNMLDFFFGQNKNGQSLAPLDNFTW